MNRVVIRGGLTKGKVGLGAGVNLFNQRAGIDFAYVNHELAVPISWGYPIAGNLKNKKAYRQV